VRWRVIHRPELSTFRFHVKNIIKNELGYTDSVLGFEEYYENLIANKPRQKKRIDKLLFEHILYGRLTNVYIHKISSPLKPSKELLLKRTEKVIESFKPYIPHAVQELMTIKGFYLMDLINVSKEGGHFMAAFDYIESNGIIERMRFLVGKNIYRTHILKDKTEEIRNEYLLGGVDINFKEGYFLILNKHTTGVQDDDDFDKIKSPSAFHNFILHKVIHPLKITTSFDYKKDQEGMSIFCKYLFNNLIDDIRIDIRNLAQSDINSFGKKVAGHISGGKKPVNSTQLKDFKEKILCLLLGIFIMNNYDEDEMSVKARNLDLVGYPTKISYKNSRSNRNATGTSRANKSIANSDTIYSLLTDFENTKYLEKWSLSWFVDLANKSNLDVVQTTVEAKRNYFKVTFIATRHFNEEIIHHVVKNLNRYRNY
jgi:hypothetical protein